MSKKRTRRVHTILNKYLAVFIMLCMVSSLVPLSAYADEEAPVDNQTAVEQTQDAAPQEVIVEETDDQAAVEVNLEASLPEVVEEVAEEADAQDEVEQPKANAVEETEEKVAEEADAKVATDKQLKSAPQAKPVAAPAASIEAAPPVPVPPGVTVAWRNYDGRLLEFDPYVPVGGYPMYNGDIPTRPEDERFTYVWVGWTPGFSRIFTNTTYIAVFMPIPKTFTVTWLNDDGTELEVDEHVPYGATPSYDSETPTKEPDAQYTYEFAGWEPELSTVTSDQTYTATYTETLRTYTVTWLDEDGTQLELDEEVPYGTDPSYDGETPTKPSTEQYDYEFAGWEPELSTVTGDQTYTATYTETLRTYTVTWLDEDGTQLELDEEVPYGTDPSYDGETPTKPSTEQYDYEFAGWEPELSTVTGDQTYTATYTEKIRMYTITYILAGGTLDGKTGSFSEVYPYGENIKLAKAPTRTGYTFQYWRGSEYEAGADYTVTGDHTFTAVWEKTPSKKKESTPSKTILPRTGDDFNASVPFAIGLMGALLIGAGYVMRRRNQHINR